MAFINNMCLIVMALHVHPEYPLIIAANRDEFYLRPTAPLAYWDDQTHILAGRDLQGKGTWLGVSRNGRMAAVTNYRDPTSNKPGALSRGLLGSGFLMEAQSPEAYVHRISDQGNFYNGFNLIVGDLSQYWWVSNLAPAPMKLTPGIHGISNRLLNTPRPKLEKAKAELEMDVDKAKVELKEQMIKLTMTEAEKIIRERLDSDKHREMIGRFIDNVEKA